ncbi:MAG: T9SS type A sorting domain-containing protein [Ferruginibacter sp.]
MNGQEAVKRAITLQPGENIVIKDLDTVAPGIYILELRKGDDVFTQKILKQ